MGEHNHAQNLILWYTVTSDHIWSPEMTMDHLVTAQPEFTNSWSVLRQVTWLPVYMAEASPEINVFPPSFYGYMMCLRKLVLVNVN